MCLCLSECVCLVLVPAGVLTERCLLVPSVETTTPHTHHTAPCATDTAPTVGATGTCVALTQLKMGRRGNPLAPEITTRHGTLGRNKEKKTNGI